MNKPNGIYQDDTNKEINFIDLNQPITVLLASSSKFFLEGINKVLRNEKGLIIAWEVQDQEEIEKSLERIKPDILFIDNRALKFDIRIILPLINSDTRLILLGDRSTGELDLPNVTYLTRHTNSSELILAMRKSLYKSMAINIEEYKPSAISSLTPSSIDETETIIDLTEEVFFEEEDKIKLFDDELSLQEEITSSSQEFDDLYSLDNHGRKMDRYPRVRAFTQFSLLLLLAFGVIYFGTKYMYLVPDLRGFTSFNSFPQADSKIEHDIKIALSDQGFQDINVSVNEGKVVLSGKVHSEEDFRKASIIAKEVKGVNDVENHLVVKKTVTDIESTPDMEEIEFFINEKPEKENNGKVSRLNTNENVKSNESVVEKKVTDSKGISRVEVTQPLQRDTNQDPEERNSRKVSYPNPKNVMINRSALEKETDESRRFHVLAELEKEVKRKEIVEVIRTDYEKPRKLESTNRVSALPSTRDASIARDIEKALASEGYENIEVSVNNGEVFLTGEVETHLDHIFIHRIALKTDGVKKIKSVLGVSEYSNTQ